MAHIIASPDEIIYRKLGLDPKVDYHRSAIGVLTLTPSETAIITADLAIKASAIQIGFIDRFSGTLIITGTISDVNIAFERILEYTSSELGFTVCKITKAGFHTRSREGQWPAHLHQLRGYDAGHEGQEDNIP